MTTSRPSLPGLAACIVLWGCGGSDGPVQPPGQPPPGSQGEDILVIARTVGDDQDLDGYSLAVDGLPGVSIGPNEQLTVRDLAVALHNFQLTGMAAHCRQTTVDHLVGSNTYTITVFCLPPNSGTIYYLEDSDFTRLSSMTVIGGDSRTFGPSWVRDFSVSTDGEQIAYERRVPPSDVGSDGGLSHIFIMGPDGSNPIQLTGAAGIGSDTNNWEDISPTWAPDGFRIVYAAGAQFLSRSIFVINSDGSGFTQIAGNGPAYDKPDWSPDGTRIALHRSQGSEVFVDRFEGGSIHVMNQDGSDLEWLTDGAEGRDGEARWSPDGARIAFARELDQGRAIFVMNADGTGIEQLTSLPSGWCDAFTPRWSPDGSWIVFHIVCEPFFRPEIYVMREDGTDVVELGIAGLTPEWVR